MSAEYWIAWAVVSIVNIILFMVSMTMLRKAESLYKDASKFFRHRLHCGDDECEEAHP